MKPAHRTLAKWMLLIAMFLAIWQFFSPEAPSSHRPETSQHAERSSGSTLVIGWVVALLGLAIFNGAIFGWRRQARRWQAAARVLNAAIAALEEGDEEATERLLDELEREHPKQLLHAVHAQRATLAIRRAQRESALRFAERAVAEPMPLLVGRGFAREYIASARATRAFLRAASGDAAGARADMEAVAAPDSALYVERSARVALAEALLLERAGDRAALREHLLAEQALLGDFTPPRERALVAALLRSVDDDGASSSVYRNPAEQESGERALLVDWVLAFAPSAAPFVRTPRGERARAAEPATPEPSAGARAASNALRTASTNQPPQPISGKRTLKTLLLWAYLVFVLLFLWQLSESGTGFVVAWAVALVAAPLGLLIAWSVRRGRRAWSRLWSAGAALARDQLEEAERRLLPLRDEDGALAAQAYQQLAEISFRRGQFERCLEECEAGWKKIAGQPRWANESGEASSSQERALITYAGMADHALTRERAAALAALGRADEAYAELELVDDGKSGRLALMVELLSRLRAGKFAAAAELFAARAPDLTLGRRVELLGQLALATTGDLDEAEVRRLRALLRREPLLARWVDVISPELVTRLDRPGSRQQAADSRLQVVET